MMNTKEQIVDKLNQDNAEESKANRIHKALSHFIKTQEESGKTKVDGWWERRAKAYFTTFGWTVRFYTIAGQYYLNVSGGDSGYTSTTEVRMFLGYNTDMGNLTVGTFEERNRSYGSAAEARIQRRKALTASDNDTWLNTAAAAIDQFKAAKAHLEMVMGECGPTNEAFYIIKELSGYVDNR
jgi:hypothetical protein